MTDFIMPADPVLIDMPMPIITPRLTLRPVQAGDGAALHEAKRETWDMLTRWMPWAKEIGTAEADEATVRKAYARFILREDLMIGGFARDTGRFVIGTGLHRFNWAVRRFEIGYWVRHSAQGQGYATEAANALTRYAFGALGARAVAIDVAEGNAASMAVARKLGFRKEGEAAYDIVLPSGDVTHRHIFSCTDARTLPALDVTSGAALPFQQ